MRAEGRDLRFRRPERQGIDTSTIVHRRDLVARHGSWKERQDEYAHDWELVSRWVAAGEPWACTRMATVDYGTSLNAQSAFMASLADRRASIREASARRDEARRAADAAAVDPLSAAEARWAARREVLTHLATLDDLAGGVTVDSRAMPYLDGEPPFRWRGAWWRVAAASREGAPVARHLVRLDERLREVASFPLRGYGSPFDATCWMPIVEGDRLRFVYSLGPTIVVDASAGDGTIVVDRGADPGAAIDHWRGGVAPLAFEGGALAVVHEGERGTRAHRFVVLDDGLVLVAASEPFRFRPAGDEIVAGIDPDPGGARVRVQLAGASGGLVSIAFAEVRAMLRPFPPGRGGR
jgi:hypothetical protein